MLFFAIMRVKILFMKTSNNQVTKLYLNIANFNIELRFQPTDFKQSQQYCQTIIKYFEGFIVSKSKTVDFILEFTFNPNNYQALKNRKSLYMFIYEQINNKHYLTHYGISLFQFQLIFKDILAQLLQKKGLLIHGSACVVNNKAQLFLGPSGAGKTTAVRLLRKNFLPIADDSLILKKEGQQYCVYQTPFREKVSWIKKTNRVWKLGNIFWLKKNKKLSSKKLITSVNKKVSLITKQVWTDKIDQNTFSVIVIFCNKSRNFYELQFSKDRQKLGKLITD